MTDKLRTFNEWRNEGFVVRKGEKAIGFNAEGIALFSIDQVKDVASDQVKNDGFVENDGLADHCWEDVRP